MLSKMRKVRKGKKDKAKAGAAPAAPTKKVPDKALECHQGVREILPGIWVGRLSDIERQALDYNFNRVYALAEVSGRIWDTGWRGLIVAVPIRDMGTLPTDVLDRTVQDILARARAGERVALGCWGGHGRTGYVAAALLGVARPEVDPIATVRTQYCQHAVESEAQIKHLAEYLGRDDLLQHAPSKTWPQGGWWEDADDLWWSHASAATASATTQPKPQGKGRIPYAQHAAFLGHDAVVAISRVARVPRERVDLLSEVVSPEVTDSEEPVLLYGSHLWWVDPLAGFAVTEQRQEDGALAYVGYRYRLLDAAAPTTPAPGT